jgi:hypothetical protein
MASEGASNRLCHHRTDAESGIDRLSTIFAKFFHFMDLIRPSTNREMGLFGTGSFSHTGREMGLIGAAVNAIPDPR